MDIFEDENIAESVSAPWRESSKVAKEYRNFCIVLMIAVIVLAFGYMFIFPLKSKELVVMEFQSGKNNFVKITKANGDVSSNLTLISMFMRMYVVDRERVDHISEKDIRYPRVLAMSSPQVTDTFKKIVLHDDSIFNQLETDRSILIKRDSSLTKGIHQVEFQTIDQRKGRKETIKQDWIATIQYKFMEQEVTYDERLLNPIGIIVTNYSISKSELEGAK